jgi:hypothetical protein
MSTISVTVVIEIDRDPPRRGETQPGKVKTTVDRASEKAPERGAGQKWHM